jgi:hypothetical protein
VIGGAAPLLQSVETPVTPQTIAAATKRLGFDPTTADENVLLASGLPWRPNAVSSGEAYQGWLKAVVTPTTSIVRNGGVRIPDVHRHALRETQTAQLNAAPLAGSKTEDIPVTNLAWSGYEGNGFQGTFGVVNGEWIVPSLKYPPVEGDVYFSATWVGIDGGKSVPPYPSETDDVFQTGTEQDETWESSDGFLTTNYYIWWEQAPNVPYFELSTGAGHDVGCQMLKFFQDNRAAAQYWCKDYTTGQVAVFDQWVDSLMQGYSAEWITEREGDNGAGGETVYPLSNYGTILMKNAWFDTTTNVYFPYANAYPSWNEYDIQTHDANGALVQEPYPINSTSFGFEWYGSF